MRNGGTFSGRLERKRYVQEEWEVMSRFVVGSVRCLRS